MRLYLMLNRGELSLIDEANDCDCVVTDSSNIPLPAVRDIARNLLRAFPYFIELHPQSDDIS